MISRRDLLNILPSAALALAVPVVLTQAPKPAPQVVTIGMMSVYLPTEGYENIDLASGIYCPYIPLQS